MARQLWEDREWEQRMRELKKEGPASLKSGRDFKIGDKVVGSYKANSEKKAGENNKQFLSRHENKVHRERSRAVDEIKNKLRENAEKIQDPITTITPKTTQKKTGMIKKVLGKIKNNPKKSIAIGASSVGITAGSLYGAKKYKERKIKKKLDNLKDYDTL